MSGPRIIQLGLPWDYHIFSQQAKDFVRPALEKGTQKMDAAGFQYKQFDVTPEEGVQPLVDYLKTNTVDGAVIGAGLRKTDEMMPLVEKLIDTLKTHSPKSIIMFNTAPDGALEAALRYFPKPTSKQ